MIRRFLFVAVMLLLAVSAIAEQLDVATILAKQKSGASAEALLAAVNDPANTLTIKAEDFGALRSGGVPEPVISAIQQRIAGQTAAPPATSTAPAAPAPVTPDDPRLGDVVKIVKSGISESIIAEEIKQSGIVYKLTMNDLLYLKQNGVQDSVISALLATKSMQEQKVVPPAETVYSELELVRGWRPFNRQRPGRLVLKGETFSWIDGSDPKENFEFKVSGLEKIWYTCQSHAAGEVCYQINFQVVKGPRYSFLDVSHVTGSNATVKAIMDKLRADFPRAAFGAAEH